MKKQQVMLFNSEKKHSVRYDAEDKNNANIVSVYIMNEAFAGMQIPLKVTITIEAE